MFEQLSFQHSFRKYQHMILAQMETGQPDQRYHIVAPPGAGKTIVGLELIRRFGFPAVVFAPTTTIQAQWQEKVGMFLAEPSSLANLTSLDPQRLAPINIFTYQVISTPGEAQERVQAMAIQKWLDDLLLEGKAADPVIAQARLDTLRQNNPIAYRSELSRRYLRIKRDLLRSPQTEIAQFLHPNARQLIRSLVNYGVRTIVLDECHHLLDYWAIVLRNLIGQIPDPRVVGLTATLPNPEDDDAYENYTSLLGEIDFEVPTPAVVKEGDLAPYRDLVCFVQPSGREAAYLANVQTAFETAIGDLTDSPGFQNWVAGLIAPARDEPAWERFLQDHPLLSLAALRFLKRIRHPVLAELALPAEVEETLTLEDWANLLERYGLEALKVSPDPEDYRQLTRLRKVLLQFGLTLTERGLRQGRSPGDLVLAFSESKDRAVAHILTEEAKALGERLRAVVVMDFERMSSGVRPLKAVLDADAGSAVRLFGYLVNQPELDDLDPVLVTGRTLLVDARQRVPLLEWFNVYLQRQNLQAVCRFEETDLPKVLEVTGEGRDWSPRAYVGMVTAAFEAGLTRCLVGTRGIFGEGWDSLSLNTLIDLTSITTSTAVQQLRGRSIRKDPRWPRKVAHNWDVICVAPEFEKGDGDLRRFVQRHNRYWGIVPGLWATRRRAGQVVKGVAHIDPDLAFELETRSFQKVDFARYTAKMLAAVGQREQVYDWWGVGRPYENLPGWLTRLEAPALKMRTASTIRHTVWQMARQFFAPLVLSLSYFIWSRRLGFLADLTGPLGQVFTPIAWGLLLGAGGVGLYGLSKAYRLGRAILLEQPVDTILADVGRALVAALRQAGLIAYRVLPDYVWVEQRPDVSCQVSLENGSPEDVRVFTQAYDEIFRPVWDQRYLIIRHEAPPSGSLLSDLRAQWRGSQRREPACYPVPRVLAARKEQAELYARCWKKFVGDGELIFTRSETGRRWLLNARLQRRSPARGLAFEIWR
jgi:hypothetical protein